MDWSLIISILLTLIGMPFIVSYTTAWLGSHTKDMLVTQWGDRGQLYVGGLGTAVHEAGHAVMAILFRHHIVSMKLVQFRHLDTSKTLGYVNHTWDVSSFYQNLGNFFIGIAPFFACSGTLYGLHQWLIGTDYRFMLNDTNLDHPDTVIQLLSTDSHNLMNSFISDVQHPLMSIVFALLVLAISTTGYDISKADWKNTMYGLRYYLLVSVIATVIIWATVITDPSLSTYMWSFITVIVFLMLDSWVYTLFSMALIIVVRRAIDKRYRILPQFKQGYDHIISWISPRGKHFKR